MNEEEIILKTIPELTELSIEKLNPNDLIIVHHDKTPYKFKYDDFKKAVLKELPFIAGYMKIKVNNNTDSWNYDERSGIFQNATLNKISGQNGQYNLTLSNNIIVGKHLIWGNCCGDVSGTTFGWGSVSVYLPNYDINTEQKVFKITTAAGPTSVYLNFELFCLYRP